MTLVGTHSKLEDWGGSRIRHIQSLRPIAYWDVGQLRPVITDFADSGIPDRPHMVSTAPIMVTASQGGDRRIHPTREIDRYIEFGAPYINPGGDWKRVSLGNPVRSGNVLFWDKPQANVSVCHGGHFIKLEIELKGGWLPPNNQFAFPVGLIGLTREGSRILRDDVVIGRMNCPYVYDSANVENARAVGWEFANVAGQTYALMTLPSLAGMTRPVIDPTLDLQPAEAAGDDTLIYQHSDYKDANWGLYGQITAGGGAAANQVLRGLIRFDVSSIPETAKIISATLTLYCESEAVTTDYDVGVHRGLNQWYEGAHGGAACNVSEDCTTWNNRNNNGPVAWTGGAGGAAGSDWVAAVTSVVTITGPVAFFDWDVKADVQGFVNGTYTNRGWWLIATSEAVDTRKRFTSSSGTTASQRPEIEIVYSLVDGVPAFMNFQRRRRTA